MTPEQEEDEILKNTRAAHEAGEIDKWQKWDVYEIIARAWAERELSEWTR